MKNLKTGAAALIAGCILLYSCHPPGELSRKDTKALDRVKSSRKMIDSMRPLVMELYPCVADTFATVLPGGIDSIPYPVTIFDSTGFAVALEEMRNEECRAQVQAAYKNGYNYAVGMIKGKKIAVKRPDTLRITTMDHTENDALKKQIIYMGATLDQNHKTIAARTKWMWILGGLLLLAILFITRKLFS